MRAEGCANGEVAATNVHAAAKSCRRDFMQAAVGVVAVSDRGSFGVLHLPV